jgi:hypothetical protein
MADPPGVFAEGFLAALGKTAKKRVSAGLKAGRYALGSAKAESKNRSQNPLKADPSLRSGRHRCGDGAREAGVDSAKSEEDAEVEEKRYCRDILQGPSTDEFRHTSWLSCDTRTLSMEYRDLARRLHLQVCSDERLREQGRTVGKERVRGRIPRPGGGYGMAAPDLHLRFMGGFSHEEEISRSVFWREITIRKRSAHL